MTIFSLSIHFYLQYIVVKNNPPVPKVKPQVKKSTNHYLYIYTYTCMGVCVCVCMYKVIYILMYKVIYILMYKVIYINV